MFRRANDAVTLTAGLCTVVAGAVAVLSSDDLERGLSAAFALIFMFLPGLGLVVVGFRGEVRRREDGSEAPKWVRRGLVGMGGLFILVGLASGITSLTRDDASATPTSYVIFGAIGVALMLVVAWFSWQSRFRRCPDCAEDVRAEAKVCPYCGHRFDPADSE